MALVIEDGTGLSNSESYVDVTEFQAYADKRGLSIPSDNAACEVLLIKAMDYLDAKEHQLQGARVSAAQSLSYPREGLKLFGFYVEDNAIPELIKKAQMELAFQAQSQELAVTNSGQELLEQEVPGVIMQKFSETGNKNKQPVFEKVEQYLKPLYKAMSYRISR